MNIVLHQPEIPANTGNIGRTCVATGTVLHLIEPLGFRLTGKELRRAGMDYWEHLDVRRYMNFEEFAERNLAQNPEARIWMATTKARKVYTQAAFGREDFIMFGRESAGIPEDILVDHEDTCIRIPRPDQEPESVKQRRHRALRGAEAAGICRHADGGRAAPRKVAGRRKRVGKIFPARSLCSMRAALGTNLLQSIFQLRDHSGYTFSNISASVM